MKPDDDMNIILVGKRHGKSRVLSINSTLAAGLLFLVLSLLVAAGWAGYQMAVQQVEAREPTNSELVAEWKQKLADQKAELASIEENVQQQVDALTLRLGEIQGRLLRLDALGQRLADGEVKELIIATNPTVEGEATAHYLAQLARQHSVRPSRLAQGMPLGGELEYVDRGTLSHAFGSRSEMG